MLFPWAVVDRIVALASSGATPDELIIASDADEWVLRLAAKRLDKTALDAIAAERVRTASEAVAVASVLGRAPIHPPR